MNNVAQEMKHLNELAKRDPGKRFTKLWDNMTSELWLTTAWEQIRTKKGNQSLGPKGTTVADIDLEFVRTLSKGLREGRYQPTPVRRTYIPKGNGKLRPLGIVDLEDKLVQQALRMMLEPIFEADFRGCSHGFRQGHSTHTALRQVASLYPRVSWTIEGDIVGCFDNIPHDGVLHVISRRVADQDVVV